MSILINIYSKLAISIGRCQDGIYFIFGIFYSIYDLSMTSKISIGKFTAFFYCIEVCSYLGKYIRTRIMMSVFKN